MKKAIALMMALALAVSALAQTVTTVKDSILSTKDTLVITKTVTTKYDTLHYVAPVIAGINSMDLILQDMSQNGEATPWTPIKPGTNPPTVWFPSNWSWYWGNNLATENQTGLSGQPGGMYPNGAPNIFPWYVIFSYGGNVATTNTRVQIRNVYAYWYSKSQKKWILATGSNAAFGVYDRYDTNVNYGTASMRSESTNGGGTSVKPITTNCIQGWTTGGYGSPIVQSDCGGFFAYSEARLIIDNLSLPDDRPKANLILCPGADYKDPAKASINGGTVGGVCCGRFKKLTNNWKAFNIYVMMPGVTPVTPPINKFD